MTPRLSWLHKLLHGDWRQMPPHWKPQKGTTLDGDGSRILWESPPKIPDAKPRPCGPTIYRNKQA